MPKTIKEVYSDYTGVTTVEYSDDSTRTYTVDDIATVNTNPLTRGGVLVAGSRQLNQVNNIPALRAARAAAWNAGPIIVAPARANTAAYAVGDSVRLTDGTHVVCTGAGTSGGAEPTGYIDGRPITDGTVTWYQTGWKKTANDVDAPTVTYSATAAAAGLTETKFVTGTAAPTVLRSFDCIPFNRSGGAFVGLVGGSFGNSSYTGNANGDVSSGTGFPIAFSGEAYNIAQADLEFFVTDSKFMLVTHNSLARIQVLIDGKPCFGAMPLQAGVSGSGYVFDFGGVHKERKIVVTSLFSAGGITLRGVGLTAQGSIRAVPSTSDVMLLLGDSFCSTVAPTISEGHMGSYLKRYLGLGGLVNAGVGGSGYIVTSTAGTYNIPSMLASPSNRAIFSYLNPSHVFLQVGGNDRATKTVAEIQAAALASWQAIRAQFPSAKISISDGYSGNSGPDAQAIAMSAGLQATFNQWADGNSRFITEVGAGGSAAYIWGTGNAGAALTTGNSSIYTSTDLVHPSPAGARYLAAKITDALNVAWNGDY